jgi:hypothetical protein
VVFVSKVWEYTLTQEKPASPKSKKNSDLNILFLRKQYNNKDPVFSLVKK